MAEISLSQSIDGNDSPFRNIDGILHQLSYGPDRPSKLSIKQFKRLFLNSRPGVPRALKETLFNACLSGRIEHPIHVDDPKGTVRYVMQPGGSIYEYALIYKPICPVNGAIAMTF